MTYIVYIRQQLFSQKLSPIVFLIDSLVNPAAHHMLLNLSRLQFNMLLSLFHTIKLLNQRIIHFRMRLTKFVTGDRFYHLKSLFSLPDAIINIRLIKLNLAATIDFLMHPVSKRGL